MNSPWTVIFYTFAKPIMTPLYSNLINSTLDLLDNDIYVETVYNFSDTQLDNIDSVIIEDPFVLALSRIKPELDNHKNVMIFGSDIGLINSERNDKSFKFLRSNIYNAYGSNPVYDQIMHQNELDKLLIPDFLVIPYSPSVMKLWDSIISIYDSLIINNKLDPWSAFIIALSLSNQKFGAFEPPEYISDLFNPAFYADIIEYSMGLDNPRKYFNLITDNQYIYYPYYDVIMNNDKNMDETSDIFNTSGFRHIKYDILDDKLYKRYSDPLNGLFTKAANFPWNIPKFLHCLMVDNTDIIKLKNRTEQILRNPWEVNIWTPEAFLLNPNIDPFWKETYSKIIDPSIQTLAIYFGILERYGGVIMPSNYELLKQIPNIILNNQFVVGYKNLEKNLDLSYDILGSIPGEFYNNAKKDVNYHSGRVVYPGANNLYKSQPVENFNNITPIFTIFRSMILGLHDLQNLQNYLVTTPDISILPDYYFDKLNYPEIFSNFTIFKSKPVIVEEPTPQPPRFNRSYIVTEEAMNNRILRNPRDTLFL